MHSWNTAQGYRLPNFVSTFFLSSSTRKLRTGLFNNLEIILQHCRMYTCNPNLVAHYDNQPSLATVNRVFAAATTVAPFFNERKLFLFAYLSLRTNKIQQQGHLQVTLM